jgi:hypothetical protein
MFGSWKTVGVKITAGILFEGDPEGFAVELAAFSNVAVNGTKTGNEQNLYATGILHGFSPRQNESPGLKLGIPQ